MTSTLDTNSIFRVDGMVAVITGGGTGIGLTMARALASQGAAKVYLLGRRLAVLEEVAKEHPSFVAVQCDVTSKDSLQAAVDKITSESGFVNLLVANSGVGASVGFGASSNISELRQAIFSNYAAEDFTHTLHVNVSGVFFTLGAFLELLDAGNKKALAGGFGAPLEGGTAPSVQSQVIITSSLAAFSRNRMSPPAYGASKAGAMWLMKSASSALAPHGIRVNALAPGLFPSELAAGLINNRKPEEETPEDPRFIPTRRFGGDEEMAGTILYLASRAGAYCNGMHILSDGGRAAVMSSSY